MKNHLLYCITSQFLIQPKIEILNFISPCFFCITPPPKNIKPSTSSPPRLTFPVGSVCQQSRLLRIRVLRHSQLKKDHVSLHDPLLLSHPRFHCLQVPFSPLQTQSFFSARVLFLCYFSTLHSRKPLLLLTF